jgi:hypothetical protein
MLRTIERPTNATLRPWLWAVSSTCCMRCTWLAKLATMTCGGLVANACVDGRADRALGDHEAGDLGVGRVDEEQVDTLLAEAGEGAQVGDPAVERQLVELDVAGVQHQSRPAVRMATARRVGDGVVDRDELEVERPHPWRSPSATDDRAGGRSVLGALGLDAARASGGSRRRGMSGRSRSR